MFTVGQNRNKPISDAGRRDQCFCKKKHVIPRGEIHNNIMYCLLPQKQYFVPHFSLVSLEKYTIVSCNNSEYYFLSLCMPVPVFHILNPFSSQFPGIVSLVVYFCLM